MEKKPWFALVSFILLNVLGHDLVRQVKNCSKPQALRAIPSLMLKGTATGQIICDIIIYSDVYEGSEVLMRDQDLMILVRAEEESPQRRNFLSHLLTRMFILYIVNSLTIAEKERSRVAYWFCNAGTMEKTNHDVHWGRQQREQTGVLISGWAALRAAWLQSHSQDEHTKALQTLQGAPLWMMGSLEGKQWCCSINWINGQWRLAFLALQRQELTAWEQKN